MALAHINGKKSMMPSANLSRLNCRRTFGFLVICKTFTGPAVFGVLCVGPSIITMERRLDLILQLAQTLAGTLDACAKTDL